MKCAVKRIGLIQTISHERATAVLLVENRVVEVPLSRLAEGLQIGDFVRWAGACWVRETIDFD
jgi:hypothetical protein